MTPPEIRIRLRSGSELVQGKCPGCATWADLDEDQIAGRVSMDCIYCAYHETHDLQLAVAIAVAERRLGGG